MTENTKMLQVKDNLSLFIIDKSGTMTEPSHVLDVKEFQKLQKIDISLSVAQKNQRYYMPHA